MIITPHKKWLDLGIGNIWKYRDLLVLFVRRDIVAIYKQTILGPVWFLLQPIFSTIVYTFVFGTLAGLSTDGLPQPLFYIAGITAWNYFSDCLTKTSNVFRDNVGIFGKVYFPRIISPLSIVGSNLLRFCVQLILLVIMIIYYSFQGYDLFSGATLLLLPVFILMIAMQGLGLGMMVTAMTTKYRDLTYLVGFGISLLMYGAPVVYPLSSLSGKMYWVVAANPMTFVIEGFKAAALGSGTLSWTTFGYAAGCSVFILFIGYLIFNRVEKNFVDTI